MTGSTCLVCLKSFPSTVSYSGTGADRLLSYKFWNFAKYYFKISTTVPQPRANTKAFCERCGNLVDSICQLYSDIAALQLRLSSKVGDLGELLNNSSRALSNKQLAHLILWKIAKQLRIHKVAHLNEFRTLLMEKCEEKRKGSMPQVNVERLKVPASGLPLNHLPLHSTSLDEEEEKKTLKVEYIMVEKDDEDSSQASSPSHPDFDDANEEDYDNDKVLASPNPNPSRPSSPPLQETGTTATESESQNSQKLSKQMQSALKLVPTIKKKDEPKQKKLLKKEKIKSIIQEKVEEGEGSRTSRRRKSVLNKLSYVDDEEEEDEDRYLSEMKKRNKDEEYVPEKPVPSFLNDKDLKPVKGRTIFFFKIALTRVGSGETYECTKCKTVIENRWDILRAHVVKEHTDIFLCSQCGKRFGRKCKFNQHLQSHKKTVKCRKKEECKICGRPCSIINLKDHLWTHYSEEDKTLALARGEKLPYRKNKNFHCDQCYKSFYSMGTLEAHFKEAHDEQNVGAAVPRPRLQKKKRLCTVCGAHVNNLVNHMKNHKAYEERQFVCVACDKKFLTQHCLQEHKSRVHLNLKPFQCDTCGNSYKSKASLKLHCDKRHEKAKVYQCDKCPMKFVIVRWYEKHIREKHGSEGGGAQQLASSSSSQAQGLEEEQKQPVEPMEPVEVKHQQMKVDNEHDQFQPVNLSQPILNAGYQLPNYPNYFY